MSDPRVKQALGKLAPKDRIIQICGIEALEQVRRHKAGAFPDMLAREGGSVSATGLTVSDGAFRSQHKWYAIDFTCKANAETMVIDAFSYNIGRAIPEGEWARRQLPGISERFDLIGSDRRSNHFLTRIFSESRFTLFGIRSNSGKGRYCD